MWCSEFHERLKCLTSLQLRGRRWDLRSWQAGVERMAPQPWFQEAAQALGLRREGPPGAQIEG